MKSLDLCESFVRISDHTCRTTGLLLEMIVDAEQDFSECFNYILLGNAALLQFLSFLWLLECGFCPCIGT